MSTFYYHVLVKTLGFRRLKLEKNLEMLLKPDIRQLAKGA